MIKYLWVYLKGIAMGTADVVPGVSGGTIAFITGIYDTLLSSINSFDLQAFRLLKKLEFVKLWNHINGNFLFFLLAGIGTAIFSLAKLFSFLLSHYPVAVWSFFFGLIAASIWFMFTQLKGLNFMQGLLILIGTLFTYYISIASPVQGPDNLWFIFICGAIAICAMILPGISGSFILLLLGAYPTILEAVSTLNIPVILVFMAGAVIGILSFSRFVKHMLDNYRLPTLALLTGFLVGSLYKVWPWKTNIETRINSKNQMVPYLDKNVWPSDFSILSEQDIALGFVSKEPLIGLSALLMLIGAALVVVLALVGNKNKA